jgi:hypothetical protein
VSLVADLSIHSTALRPVEQDELVRGGATAARVAMQRERSLAAGFDGARRQLACPARLEILVRQDRAADEVAIGVVGERELERRASPTHLGSGAA